MLHAKKNEVGFAIFVGLAVFIVPQISFAQVVPVMDKALITAFNTYSANFTAFSKKTGTQLEDLKTMIAGTDNSGQTCEYIDQDPVAEAYPDGAWTAASSQSGGHIPTTKTARVSSGDSLRCLLQEMVGWQKLGLSMQIHAMLKTYIADAQARQLNNQLLGKISAAKLRWASQGNQVISKGGNSKSPVYETNALQSINNEKSRRLQHLTAQATGDADVEDFGVCRSWKFDVAANAVQNSLQDIEDPIQSGPARMRCGDPADGDNFGKFSASFNAGGGVGGMEAFTNLFSDPTASPLGATAQLNGEAVDALARQEEATKFRKSTTGADADVECSGLPGDPFCLSTLGTAVTPAFQNARAVEDAAASGDAQVLNADNLDGGAGSTAEEQSTSINTSPGGLLGYDETGLLNQKTAVNDLVREFYDTIEVGYYGVDRDTTDWAQATMLMIYDEMKFNPKEPEVVVTSGEDPVPIDYY